MGGTSTTNGHTVTSQYLGTQRAKTAIERELTAQGVPDTAPIRGVVDHPYTMLAVARDGEGTITGALAYDLGERVDRDYDKVTHLQDLRADPKGTGAGEALMIHAAAESVAKGNNEMIVTGAVPGAYGFYSHLGGDQSGHMPEYFSWDEAALRQLASKVGTKVEPFIEFKAAPVDRIAAKGRAKKQLLAAEAGLQEIVHAWYGRMVPAITSKVKGQKSRRGTRHWKPMGERKLDPARSVDASKWRDQLEADVEPYLTKLMSTWHYNTTKTLMKHGTKATKPKTKPLTNVGGVPRVLALGPSPNLADQTKRVQAAIRAHTKRIGDFADTTVEAIRDVIAEKEGEGLSIGEIASSIADLVDEQGGYWAERVARTEITGAANEASIFAAQDSGVVDTKTWLATNDSRTRDSHDEMDGEEVPVDELFSNGLDFPGDPDGDAGEVINCRCTMLYGVGGNAVDVTGDDTEEASLDTGGFEAKEWNEEDHPRDERGRFGRTTGETVGEQLLTRAKESITDESKAATQQRIRMMADQARIEGDKILGADKNQSGQAKAQVARTLAETMKSSTDKMLKAAASNTYYGSNAKAVAEAYKDSGMVLQRDYNGVVSVQSGFNFQGVDITGNSSLARGGTPEAEQMAREYAVSSMIQQWAGTSNDADVQSLAMQEAAKREFRLTDTAPTQLLGVGHMQDDVRAELKTNGAVYKDFVRAQYNETQRQFAEAGVKDITLCRGMGWNTRDSVRPWARVANRETVKNGAAEPAGFRLRPLSSWSSSDTTAKGFGGSRPYALVMYNTFPAAQILSTPRSGFGCLHESEFVVLGGKERDAIVRADYGTHAGPTGKWS